MRAVAIFPSDECHRHSHLSRSRMCRGTHTNVKFVSRDLPSRNHSLALIPKLQGIIVLPQVLARVCRAIGRTRSLHVKTLVSVERSPEEISVDISEAIALALFDMVLTLRLEKASALLSNVPTAPSAPCSDNTCTREGGEKCQSKPSLAHTLSRHNHKKQKTSGDVQ